MTKIFLGVVLPLVAFIVCLGLLFQRESLKGPDFGIVALIKFWIIYVPGILGIFVMNSLLMIPKWKSVRAVCLVGSILPAILLIAEWCLLAF